MITGLSVPLRNRAITQYLGIEATGVAMLNGKVIVTTSDGIHILDDTQSDNGTQINACVKTLKTDFGVFGNKRMRSLFIRGYIKRLKVYLNTESQNLERICTQQGGPVQDGAWVQGQRAQVGKYWQFEIRNISGEDFSVDGVDALINTLSLRR